MAFFRNLLSGEGFIPRAQCGAWTAELIRLHNLSDFFIWTAYLAIPIVLIKFAYNRRRELPFRQLFWLFGLFILACGTTHLMDIVLFYQPLYRLSGLVKLVTAAASWGTVLALFHVVPHALKMRSPQDLESEIEQRQRAEADLKATHDELEARVAARTAELRASEEKFRLLIEAMPQIVWTARPDGFLDFYNQKWVDYTGLSVEETQGWGWQPVLHPDDVQPCLDAWSRAVETGENYEIEYRFKRASDGAYRWHLGRALPLRDEGRIIQWFGTGTDIHDQKLAQQELENSREKLERQVQERTLALTQANATLEAESALRERLEEESERFFDLSLDKLCVAGFDGYFKRLNPAWEHTLGFSREELMARPFREFVHPEDLEKTESETQQNTSGQDSDAFENRYLCKDGTYKWLAWRARAVPAEQAVYATARDVTQSKLTEQVLKETMVRLERSNSELQSFASIASHDLQEPLRAIQAFGDRLQTRHSAGLDEEGRDYLVRMQNAAGRMRGLIQDLLSYSRVTIKTRPFVTVDLNENIQNILADLTVRLEETGGRVEVGDLPTLEADPMQMRQLFQNLIDNGLKFHSKEKIPMVRIYVLPREGSEGGELPDTQQWVQIVVEDNGIGIDEKHLERIFAPFERLHAQRLYSGSGIGLAICRKIAQRHGGEVSVESQLGQGSRFVLRLPLVQSRDAAQNVVPHSVVRFSVTPQNEGSNEEHLNPS